KYNSFGGKVLVTGNVTLWVTDTVFFGSGDFIYIAPGASLKLYVSAPEATIGGNGVVNPGGKSTSFQYFGLPANKTIYFLANADGLLGRFWTVAGQEISNFETASCLLTGQ